MDSGSGNLSQEHRNAESTSLQHCGPRALANGGAQRHSSTASANKGRSCYGKDPSAPSTSAGSAQTREGEEQPAHAIKEEPQEALRETGKREASGKQGLSRAELGIRTGHGLGFGCSTLADTPSRLLGMGRVESNSSGKSFLKDSRRVRRSLTRRLRAAASGGQRPGAAEQNGARKLRPPLRTCCGPALLRLRRFAASLR